MTHVQTPTAASTKPKMLTIPQLEALQILPGRAIRRLLRRRPAILKPQTRKAGFDAMTRTEQKIAAIENKLQHIDEPSGLIIYQRVPGEPEASIKRFEERYPDFDGVLIILPDNGRDKQPDNSTDD